MPAHSYNPHVMSAIIETLPEVQAKGISTDRVYRAVLSSDSEAEARMRLESVGVTPSDKLGEAYVKAHRYEIEKKAIYEEMIKRNIKAALRAR